MQSLVLLCHGKEEQSQAADLKQRLQKCCCWQGGPHACDPTSDGGISAGVWWLFRLG